MNERDRLLAVLGGGTADKTPWYGDLSWWYAARTQMGDLPDRYRSPESGDNPYSSHFQLDPTTGQGYLRLHQDTGIGIMFYPPMPWTESFSPEIRFTNSTQGDFTTSRISTPAGDLESVSQHLPESFTVAIKTHYVKNPQDLKVLRYIWQHRTVRPRYEEFESTDSMWADAGVAFCLGPICTAALQTLISRWAGIETTVGLVVDAPQELEATLEVLQSADDEVFAAISASPALVVEFPDNVAGELTGANLLRRYVLPYWKKRVSQLQAAGKLVGVHNDGGCRAALPIIIEAGFDFVEAVTPVPPGDITLAEIRETTAGKIAVMGGLPGVYFSPRYDREIFEKSVRQALSSFPRGEGFVLGVADQVPPDGEFERMCLVREILEEMQP